MKTISSHQQDLHPTSGNCSTIGNTVSNCENTLSPNVSHHRPPQHPSHLSKRVGAGDMPNSPTGASSLPALVITGLNAVWNIEDGATIDLPADVIKEVRALDQLRNRRIARNMKRSASQDDPNMSSTSKKENIDGTMCHVFDDSVTRVKTPTNKEAMTESGSVENESFTGSGTSSSDVTMSTISSIDDILSNNVPFRMKANSKPTSAVFIQEVGKLTSPIYEMLISAGVASVQLQNSKPSMCSGGERDSKTEEGCREELMKSILHEMRLRYGEEIANQSHKEDSVIDDMSFIISSHAPTVYSPMTIPLPPPPHINYTEREGKKDISSHSGKEAASFLLSTFPRNQRSASKSSIWYTPTTSNSLKNTDQANLSSTSTYPSTLQPYSSARGSFNTQQPMGVISRHYSYNSLNSGNISASKISGVDLKDVSPNVSHSAVSIHVESSIPCATSVRSGSQVGKYQPFDFSSQSSHNTHSRLQDCHTGISLNNTYVAPFSSSCNPNNDNTTDELRIYSRDSSTSVGAGTQLLHIYNQSSPTSLSSVHHTVFSSHLSSPLEGNNEIGYNSNYSKFHARGPQSSGICSDNEAHTQPEGELFILRVDSVHSRDSSSRQIQGTNRSTRQMNNNVIGSDTLENSSDKDLLRLSVKMSNVTSSSNSNVPVANRVIKDSNIDQDLPIRESSHLDLPTEIRGIFKKTNSVKYSPDTLGGSGHGAGTSPVSQDLTLLSPPVQSSMNTYGGYSIKEGGQEMNSPEMDLTLDCVIAGNVVEPGKEMHPESDSDARENKSDTGILADSKIQILEGDHLNDHSGAPVDLSLDPSAKPTPVSLMKEVISTPDRLQLQGAQHHDESTDTTTGQTVNVKELTVMGMSEDHDEVCYPDEKPLISKTTVSHDAVEVQITENTRVDIGQRALASKPSSEAKHKNTRQYSKISKQENEKQISGTEADGFEREDLAFTANVFPADLHTASKTRDKNGSSDISKCDSPLVQQQNIKDLESLVSSDRLTSDQINKTNNVDIVIKAKNIIPLSDFGVRKRTACIGTSLAEVIGQMRKEKTKKRSVPESPMRELSRPGGDRELLPIGNCLPQNSGAAGAMNEIPEIETVVGNKSFYDYLVNIHNSAIRSTKENIIPDYMTAADNLSTEKETENRIRTSLAQKGGSLDEVTQNRIIDFLDSLEMDSMLQVPENVVVYRLQRELDESRGPYEKQESNPHRVNQNEIEKTTSKRKSSNPSLNSFELKLDEKHHKPSNMPLHKYAVSPYVSSISPEDEKNFRTLYRPMTLPLFPRRLNIITDPSGVHISSSRLSTDLSTITDDADNTDDLNIRKANQLQKLPKEERGLESSYSNEPKEARGTVKVNTNIRIPRSHSIEPEAGSTNMNYSLNSKSQYTSEEWGNLNWQTSSGSQRLRTAFPSLSAIIRNQDPSIHSDSSLSVYYPNHQINQLAPLTTSNKEPKEASAKNDKCFLTESEVTDATRSISNLPITPTTNSVNNGTIDVSTIETGHVVLSSQSQQIDNGSSVVWTGITQYTSDQQKSFETRGVKQVTVAKNPFQERMSRLHYDTYSHLPFTPNKSVNNDVNLPSSGKIRNIHAFSNLGKESPIQTAFGEKQLPFWSAQGCTIRDVPKEVPRRNNFATCVLESYFKRDAEVKHGSSNEEIPKEHSQHTTQTHNNSSPVNNVTEDIFKGKEYSEPSISSHVSHLQNSSPKHRFINMQAQRALPFHNNNQTPSVKHTTPKAAAISHNYLNIDELTDALGTPISLRPSPCHICSENSGTAEGPRCFRGGSFKRTNASESVQSGSLRRSHHTHSICSKVSSSTGINDIIKYDTPNNHTSGYEVNTPAWSAASPFLGSTTETLITSHVKSQTSTVVMDQYLTTVPPTLTYLARRHTFTTPSSLSQSTRTSKKQYVNEYDQDINYHSLSHSNILATKSSGEDSNNNSTNTNRTGTLKNSQVLSGSFLRSPDRFTPPLKGLSHRLQYTHLNSSGRITGQSFNKSRNSESALSSLHPNDFSPAGGRTPIIPIRKSPGTGDSGLWTSILPVLPKPHLNEWNVSDLTPKEKIVRTPLLAVSNNSCVSADYKKESPDVYNNNNNNNDNRTKKMKKKYLYGLALFKEVTAEVRGNKNIISSPKI